MLLQFDIIPEACIASRFDSDDNLSVNSVGVAGTYNSGTRRAKIFEPVVLRTCCSHNLFIVHPDQESSSR